MPQLAASRAGPRTATRVGRGLAVSAPLAPPDYAAVMVTPLPGGARLGLRVEAGAVVAVDVLAPGATPRAPVDPTAAEAVRQIRAYFLDPRATFDLPLAPTGTPYQRRVWGAIARIPVGATETYGGLARAEGGSPRAVGGACRANPLPIVVPCHRVVAAGGRGGYMGETSGGALALKTWLLAHEAHARAR